MLNESDRKVVEAIRRAQTIRITVNRGTDREFSISVNSGRPKINQFANEVGLALQSYLNTRNKDA